jgi:hypothetical protein
MNLTETLLTPLLRDLAPDVARRLGMIVAGLIAVVARRFVRMPHLAALALPLWNRLTRTVRRFGRVMTNLAAGRAPRPGRAGRREPAPDHDRPAENRPPPPRDPLPRGRDWLVRELGWEAAGFGSQLEHMLREPGVAEMLAASPAACRILRPLCRMLAVHDDALPAAPRRARASTTKPSAPAAPPRPRQRVRRDSAAPPAPVAAMPAPWDGPLPEAPPDPYYRVMSAFVR